ncbi:MAG TPA: 2-C-methyl-D-erythritol 4-phosphate cytidylyltransferase, partial [Desulfobacteraceae bacterium]|nr:2-C-methyl-D-erythritol 4-phosphate cytidylyltransferase [Desulfobacteraceae bacterium]
TPASDTLKRVDKSDIIETTLSRENIWLAQTPQVFRFDLILKAHETARRDGYVGTDDASLVERLGEDVKIINGGRFNIKITKKEDLAIAKAMFDAGLV